MENMETENELNCKYAHLPHANCHKDFCLCVGIAMAEMKKKSKDRAIKASLTFFEKNKIHFDRESTENIVTTDYWGKKVFISLKTFKIRVQGTNKWIDKNRTSFLGPNSIMTFGSHKGKKCKDLDKGYLTWLFNNTQYLIKRELIPEGI